MFSGTQISPYPITDDFVDVILGAISALDAYKATFRIETDDMLTLLVGPPGQLFPRCAIRAIGHKEFLHAIARTSGTVFANLERSILRFGAPEAHVALDFERDLAGDTRDVDRVVHDGANTATECRKSTGLQRGHHLSLSLQEIPECR